MKAALAGEAIYKSIEPNAEISYSWRPDPEALRIETIKVDTLTLEQRRAMVRFQQEEIKGEHDAHVYAVGLDDKWTRVDNEITHAQMGLQKAEAVLQAGRRRCPASGEAIGAAAAGSHRRILTGFMISSLRSNGRSQASTARTMHRTR